MFEACGKPKIDSKREARDINNNYEPNKFSHQHDSEPQPHQPHQPYQPNPTTSSGGSMEKLIQDIKKKIKRTKGFWSKLPETLCSNQHVAGLTSDQDTKDCWNGSGKVV